MSILIVVFLLVSGLLLSVIAAATLRWQMHAWSSPQAFNGTGFASLGTGRHEDDGLSFSLIVPCREETERVMTATVERLIDQEHPDFEVIFSVGHDDVRPMSDGLSTPEIARKLARRWPGLVKVSVNHDVPKNKPKQLNSSLVDCTKSVVGVIDAESMTQPLLLAHVEATFRSRNADVVQGAVHLMNLADSWFSLRNCLEYRIWFRSRLHGHALAGFIPLGGNTVFIKRDLLTAVGGWDGECLAEDCELGVRLSSLGKRIVVCYDPEVVTAEETPATVRQLVKQRTRWALGFMQVLHKGEWRKLATRRERLSAWWTLVQQHAVALAGLILPFSLLTALFAKVAPVIAMISFLPLIPTLTMLVFEVLILHEWGREMGLRVRFYDYLRLIVSMPFYQTLIAFAVLRAGWKFIGDDFAWEKTAHAGTHLAVLDRKGA